MSNGRKHLRAAGNNKLIIGTFAVPLPGRPFPPRRVYRRPPYFSFPLGHDSKKQEVCLTLLANLAQKFLQV